MWKRFIDDVLFIWDGDLESVQAFLAHLNNNNRGIVLSHKISPVEIHFLDLKISIKEGNIVTSTFFKKTDRNGYIPLDSCHYHSWLLAVPKGQFLRLKHNYTNLDNYFREASVLKTRFIAKGYDREVLDFLIVEISNRDHQELLADKPPQGGKTESFGLAFFYNIL